MENCSLELKNVNFGVERAYILNTMLNAFGKTLSNGMVRDKVCNMLQVAVVHLRKEFSM
jgi:hypothetical protein